MKQWKIVASHRMRRIGVAVMLFAGVVGWLIVNPQSYETEVTSVVEGNIVENAGTAGGAGDGANEVADKVENGVAQNADGAAGQPLATEVLARLEVKGRAPKTGYARTEFYNGWPDVEGCSLRQRIIKREVGESAVLDGCNVVAGRFVEPYTGEERNYTTREEFSKNIQIDHMVALSDAWQKGAQYLPKETRYQIATDPLNLVAADGPANMQKGDGDAATWLPPNKAFRCEYVARQVSVKYKYKLWVTEAEREAIAGVLQKCPAQTATGVALSAEN